jgi:hypothetical protein
VKGNGALAAVLVGGGLVAVLALAGTSRESQSGGAQPPTQEVLERIVNAVASRNPAVMRKEADALERTGYTIQADELRRAADLTAAILSATDPRQAKNPRMEGDAPERAPAVPQPFSPLPGVLDAEVIPPEVNPLRIQAQALLLNLEGYPLGQEDRRLVADFQKNNGLRASGNYTPETALTLATEYGLPPPVPYWPTKGRKRSKQNYRAKLLALAARDPQRAEEFERAVRNL